MLSKRFMMRSTVLATLWCSFFALAGAHDLRSCASPTKVGQGKGLKTYQAKSGKSVVLVDREQLRIKKGKSFHLPVLKHERAKLPPAPATTIDWTNNGNTSVVPLLGNDQYGDCYAAAACHWFSLCSYQGGKGKPDSFDLQTLVNWYLQQSGGDHGLSDSDVLPNMESGWIPPHGPDKTLDYLLVDVNNLDNLQLGIYLFGPAIWLCSLEDTWLNNLGPDAHWTNDGTSNPAAGHAMVLAKVVPGNDPIFSTATWGYYNTVTYSGIKGADSEIVLCFSLKWFNAAGYAPNGLHYVDLANYWVAVGGKALPPNPFPAPNPNPGPNPVPVPGTSIIVDPIAKTVTVPSGWTVLGGSPAFGQSVPAVRADLAARGISPAIIQAISQLLEELLGLVSNRK